MAVNIYITDIFEGKSLYSLHIYTFQFSNWTWSRWLINIIHLIINILKYYFFFLFRPWLYSVKIIVPFISWKIIISGVYKVLSWLNVVFPLNWIIPYSHSIFTFWNDFVSIILFVYAFIKHLLLFEGIYNFNLHIRWYIIGFTSFLLFHSAIFSSDAFMSLFEDYSFAALVYTHHNLLIYFPSKRQSHCFQHSISNKWGCG